MTSQTLNLTGLTPEQIEQIKTIIAAFKAKNQSERIQNISEDQSIDVNHEEINMSDLFFASEILAPFNRF
jgi:uncharacterized membrane protein YgaE (UPF0421/DUF939 family)